MSNDKRDTGPESIKATLKKLYFVPQEIHQAHKSKRQATEEQQDLFSSNDEGSPCYFVRLVGNFCCSPNGV